MSVSSSNGEWTDPELARTAEYGCAQHTTVRAQRAERDPVRQGVHVD
jgi:hypothetical protein